MEPGSSGRDTGKGRMPWVVTWDTLIGFNEKLFPQESGAVVGQDLKRWWWYLHPQRFSKGQDEVLSNLL